MPLKFQTTNKKDMELRLESNIRQMPLLGFSIIIYDSKYGKKKKIVENTNIKNNIHPKHLKSRVHQRRRSARHHPTRKSPTEKTYNYQVEMLCSCHNGQSFPTILQSTFLEKKRAKKRIQYG